MVLKEAISYWSKSAERNLSAAEDLFKTKHFVECLFFCHLVIEKIMKALIVKNTKRAPLPIHDLLKLSEKTKIKFSEEKLKLLAEINEFNIRARYDSIKFKFYKRATQEYTQKYLKKVRGFYLWLKENL